MSLNYIAKRFSSFQPFTFQRTVPTCHMLPEHLISIKNKQFLIDSREAFFPTHVNPYPKSDFPMIFTYHGNFHQCDKTAVSLECKSIIDANLHQTGCILFRGLQLNNEFTFSDFLHKTGYELTAYIGGVAIRPEKEPMVYSASDENSAVCMDLHQDNIYWPKPPTKLLFHYEKVATKGGLNPILNMRDYVDACMLDTEASDILNKFDELGVRYEIFYPCQTSPAGKNFTSWQKTFQTSEPSTVENHLVRDGFDYEWDGTNLRKWKVLSPYKFHPRTGERLWVNMITANHASRFHAHPNFPELQSVVYMEQENYKYPFHIKFGDGSSVPYASIQKLRKIAWENARAFEAQNGDVLVIDNFLVQHGRIGYQGTRKLWLGICMN